MGKTLSEIFHDMKEKEEIIKDNERKRKTELWILAKH